MKKSFLITIIVTAILILFFLFYFFQTFKLVENSPPTHITGTSLGVKYSIEFFYVNSPLSVSSIQVRKIHNMLNSGNYNGIPDESHEEYLLENYKNYDNLIGYSLCGDSITIYLRKGYLIKTQSSNFVECDTFHLNINNVKSKIK